MEAFRAHSPMDPKAEESRSAMVTAFINHAMPDIKCKLQKIDELADKSIQELFAVAQKVYNNQEKTDDKQKKAITSENTKQTRNMTGMLQAVTAGNPDERKHQLRCLARGQCKHSHSRECPGCRKINVLITKKWDIGLKSVTNSPNIKIMTQDATPPMFWL